MNKAYDDDEDNDNNNVNEQEDKQIIVSDDMSTSIAHRTRNNELWSLNVIDKKSINEKRREIAFHKRNRFCTRIARKLLLCLTQLCLKVHANLPIQMLDENLYKNNQQRGYKIYEILTDELEYNCERIKLMQFIGRLYNVTVGTSYAQRQLMSNSRYCKQFQTDDERFEIGLSVLGSLFMGAISSPRLIKKDDMFFLSSLNPKKPKHTANVNNPRGKRKKKKLNNFNDVEVQPEKEGELLLTNNNIINQYNKKSNDDLENTASTIITVDSISSSTTMNTYNNTVSTNDTDINFEPLIIHNVKSAYRAIRMLNIKIGSKILIFQHEDEFVEHDRRLLVTENLNVLVSLIYEYSKLKKGDSCNNETQEEKIRLIDNFVTNKMLWRLELKYDSRYWGKTPAKGFCFYFAQKQILHRIKTGLAIPINEIDKHINDTDVTANEEMLEEIFKLNPHLDEAAINKHFSHRLIEKEYVYYSEAVNKLKTLYDSSDKKQFLENMSLNKNYWGDVNHWGRSFIIDYYYQCNETDKQNVKANLFIKFSDGTCTLENIIHPNTLTSSEYLSKQDQTCTSDFYLQELMLATSHDNNVVFDGSHFHFIDWQVKPKYNPPSNRLQELKNELVKNILFILDCTTFDADFNQDKLLKYVTDQAKREQFVADINDRNKMVLTTLNDVNDLPKKFEKLSTIAIPIIVKDHIPNSSHKEIINKNVLLKQDIYNININDEEEVSNITNSFKNVQLMIEEIIKKATPETAKDLIVVQKQMKLLEGNSYINNPTTTFTTPSKINSASSKLNVFSSGLTTVGNTTNSSEMTIKTPMQMKIAEFVVNSLVVEDFEITSKEMENLDKAELDLAQEKLEKLLD